VATKLSDLGDKRREGQVLSYTEIENPDSGEIIVEYVAVHARNEQTLVIEWNLYRYKQNGKGVVLVGLSKRAYEEKNINEFKKGLPQNSKKWTEAFLSYKIPVIEVKKK
jgi:hypothetical protein